MRVRRAQRSVSSVVSPGFTPGETLIEGKRAAERGAFWKKVPPPAAEAGPESPAGAGGGTAICLQHAGPRFIPGLGTKKADEVLWSFGDSVSPWRRKS